MSSAGASAQQEMQVVRDETPHTFVMSCAYICCQVKVIVGQDREFSGQLLSIDGLDHTHTHRDIFYSPVCQLSCYVALFCTLCVYRLSGEGDRR